MSAQRTISGKDEVILEFARPEAERIAKALSAKGRSEDEIELAVRRWVDEARAIVKSAEEQEARENLGPGGVTVNIHSLGARQAILKALQHPSGSGGTRSANTDLQKAAGRVTKRLFVGDAPVDDPLNPRSGKPNPAALQADLEKARHEQNLKTARSNTVHRGGGDHSYVGKAAL